MKRLSISNGLTLKESCEMFETECLIKGLSQRTLAWYKECLRYFIDFVDKKNLNDIYTEDIKNYIYYCISVRKNKKTTINTRLIALKSFFNWAYESEKLRHKIVINLLKVEQEVKDTYSVNELQLLLKKPNLKHCTFTFYRNWVISNFFLCTACRVATLINIKIEDVDLLNREVLYTHVKTGKQQIIPLTKYMRNILKEYLTHRKGNPGDYLFCNCYGNKLTTNAVRLALNKYNHKRGVEKTGRHIYRNTFAKLWILNGGDAFRLQKMLGHSTIDMTKRYIEMYNCDLKVDFETFNPLNNIAIANKDKRFISM